MPSHRMPPFTDALVLAMPDAAASYGSRIPTGHFLVLDGDPVAGAGAELLTPGAGDAVGLVAGRRRGAAGG